MSKITEKEKEVGAAIHMQLISVTWTLLFGPIILVESYLSFMETVT